MICLSLIEKRCYSGEYESHRLEMGANGTAGTGVRLYSENDGFGGGLFGWMYVECRNEWILQ